MHQSDKMVVDDPPRDRDHAFKIDTSAAYSEAMTAASSENFSSSPVKSRKPPTSKLSSNSFLKKVIHSGDCKPKAPNVTVMQSLGEPDMTQISSSDVLTAISFDKTGCYLSVGDHGGRVIVFQ